MSDSPSPINAWNLVQVVKQLARDWRTVVKGQKGPATAASMREYLAHPIFTLTSLIEETTGYPMEELKHLAWYSDRVPECTPVKEAGNFHHSRPGLEGFHDEYLVGSGLRHLLSIYDQLNKCDVDGRTAIILADLETEHPGILGKFAVNEKPPGSLNANGPPGKERETKKAKASTQKGDAEAKLVSALLEWHKYSERSCLNKEPIGCNVLKRKANVGSTSSASEFFKIRFKGYSKYAAACRRDFNASILPVLIALNRDYCIEDTYGKAPPGELEHDK